MMRETDDLIAACRATFVFAYHDLYPRREEPRIAKLLARIQDRIDEICWWRGDGVQFGSGTFGVSEESAYVVNPGAHEPR